MKIYIAGPITNVDPLTCKENFSRAARLIEGLGHVPLDPWAMVDQAEGRDYNDYLLDALTILFNQGEAVYMLAGWRESFGAKLEHAYATLKGLPIYYEAVEMPEAV